VAGPSKTYVSETIAGNNSAPTAPDWSGSLTSLTNSLLQSTAGTNLGTSSHNLFEDPLLLGDMPFDAGGKFGTFVFPLDPTSKALNFNDSGATTDQRHYFRPVGGKADIGAYEFDPNSQTELLTVTAKSSDAHVVYPSATFTNGQGTNLQSNAVGDFVTYAVPVLYDDCADVALGFMRTDNSAKIKVEYRNKANPNWVLLNPSIDLWASSNTRKEWPVIANFKMPRNYSEFRFTVVGKNNGNHNTQGYQMFLDYIRLTVHVPLPGESLCPQI
jgi:hypothetical protein